MAYAFQKLGILFKELLFDFYGGIFLKEIVRTGLCNKKIQDGSQEEKKVRKREKIRNRYNQAPHLTQDTNGKDTTSIVA